MANSCNSVAGFYSRYWFFVLVRFVFWGFCVGQSENLSKAWLQLALQVGF